MSHISRVTMAKIKDREILIAALAALEFESITMLQDETGKRLSPLAHKFPGFLPGVIQQRAEIAALVPAGLMSDRAVGRKSVGFERRTDDSYQLIGDLWQTDFYNRGSEFVALILQEYLQIQAVQKFSDQGFACGMVDRDPDGTIRIPFNRIGAGMGQAVIDTEITRAGVLNLHVQGVSGPSCEEITAELIAVLDGQLMQDFTPDYFGGGDQSLLNSDQVLS